MQVLTRGSWARVRDIVKQRDNEICQYCGKQAIDGEPDHVLPLAQGGTDTLTNLVWACQECNRAKGGMVLRDWVKKMTAMERVSLPVLPDIDNIDYEAAGWECDCGGYHGGNFVNKSNGHHKSDCPILHLDGIYYSPYCSKIVEGKLILGYRVIEPGECEYCENWEEGEVLQRAKEQLRQFQTATPQVFPPVLPDVEIVPRLSVGDVIDI